MSRWKLAGCTAVLVLSCWTNSLALAPTAHPLQLAKQMLNKQGPTVIVPVIAMTNEGALTVSEPRLIMAVRAAMEADVTLEQSRHPQVRRLLLILEAWSTATSQQSYGEALRELKNKVVEIRATFPEITAPEAISFILDNNIDNLRDRLSVVEGSVFEPVVTRINDGAPLPFSPPGGGCWDCNYHDECWFGTCCAKGGSGCCSEIDCPAQ